MHTIEHDLRTFVTDSFLFGRNQRLDGDDSFLEQGLIDSTGVLELVSFLESHFQIQVADDDLVPENLDSINRLVAYVEAKLGQTTTC
jgi:acyl carrier protein